MRRRLHRYLSTVRRPFYLSISLGLANGILTIGWAYLLTQVIDRVFLQSAPLTEVTPLLGGMVVLAVLRFGCTWGGEVAANHVATRIKADLQQQTLAHVIRLGPQYTVGERSGELVNTLTEGIEALDGYFHNVLPQLFLMMLVPLAILIVVFPLDILSAVVLLVTAPLLPMFMILIGRWAGAVSKSQFETMSYLGAHFLDVMQGLTTLKLFNRSLAQTKTIFRLSDDFRVTTMRVLRVAFISSLALELLTTLSVAIIAVEIGLRLLYDRISFEQAFFVLVLAPEFYQPIRNFGVSFHASTNGLSAAQRLFDILDTPSTTPSATATLPTPQTGIELRLVDVTYTYPERSQSALNRVTLHIPPRQTTAIVGTSGAGKSTLVSLLLRFLEPSSGVIEVNGSPLAALDAGAWRQQVAWVSQQPYLFNATLRDNLRLAKPSATPDELQWAATQADLLRVIEQLPQGWDTLIGERGAHLSGGQAQRVAIARAFLKDAPLLIWDEATAHLDHETETRLLDSLDRLRQQRTTIMITHHQQTVERADSVIHLEAGRVIEHL